MRWCENETAPNLAQSDHHQQQSGKKSTVQQNSGIILDCCDWSSFIIWTLLFRGERVWSSIDWFTVGEIEQRLLVYSPTMTVSSILFALLLSSAILVDGSFIYNNFTNTDGLRVRSLVSCRLHFRFIYRRHATIVRRGGRHFELLQ